MTGNFWPMEDDIIYFQFKTTFLFFSKMEDNLYCKVNGRRQFLFKLDDDLNV